MIEVAREDGYVVSTDPARLDMDAIHAFLRTSYWSPNVPREVVERAVRHSIPFGLHARGGALAGFARVVSDRATFAYLADVFILPEHRGHGLGLWLVETLVAHPDLVGLRWLLHTRDAHALYARAGFQPAGERVMERPRPQ